MEVCSRVCLEVDRGWGPMLIILKLREAKIVIDKKNIESGWGK